MSIAKTVKQFLDSKHVVYTVIELASFDSPFAAAEAAGVSPAAVYYPVVVRDSFGLMVVVLPATHKLNHARLSQSLSRKVEPAYQTQLSAVFADCQPDLFPPLGDAYGIRTIIDASLQTPEEVYILVGDRSRLIKLSRKNFLQLQSNAWLCNDIALPLTQSPSAAPAEVDDTGEHQFNLRQRLDQTSSLPPMPEMASQVLKLQSDPKAGVKELVEIVEQDPSMAALVMRYANSAFFGYQGRVSDLQVAVARVLGFDMTLNMMLGMTLARPFKLPKHGPLGLDALWRQAVYSATLSQSVIKLMPKEQRPRRGACYLAGLLHNFGLLVLGHLFRKEYLGLCEAYDAATDETLPELERRLLGVEHTELGALLFSGWNLPPELVIALSEHHNPAYSGVHEVYPRLMRVVDTLLKGFGIGEAESAELLKEDLLALGLNEGDLVQVAGQVIAESEALNQMARQLAA